MSIIANTPFGREGPPHRGQHPSGIHLVVHGVEGEHDVERRVRGQGRDVEHLEEALASRHPAASALAAAIASTEDVVADEP